MSEDITVVIPVFNEAEHIASNLALIRSACDVLANSFSYLLVDDGSRDRTREVLQAMHASDPKVQYISFTRNFGKEAAIEAGLSYARGRACIVMDSDLQHPPSLIPQMLREWENGALVVDAVKRYRNDGWLRSFLSNIFYSLFKRVSKIDLKDRSDFKLLDRQVISFYLGLRERHKFFRGVIAWSGFRSADIQFDVADRIGGDTKWSLRKLSRYALANIAAFTYIPMMALGWVGFITIIITFVVAVVSFMRWIFGEAVPGFTTVILLLTFLGGVILLGLGVIAYYISMIVDEARDRPRYVVEVSES